MRTSEQVARLAELNVLLKMFEIPATAYYNRGQPNNNAKTWRYYPFRIDMAARVYSSSNNNVGALPGSIREKLETVHMFGTLAELDKQVHKLVREAQAAQVADDAV